MSQMRYVLRLFTRSLLDLLNFDYVDDLTGGHNTNKEEDVFNEFYHRSFILPMHASKEKEI